MGETFVCGQSLANTQVHAMKAQRQVITDFQRTQRIQEIKNEETAEINASELAKKNHDFVQFQREGMKQFVGLIRRSPAAAQALIALATHMGRTNVLKVPMKDLHTACGTSRATMSRAMKLLRDEGWLRVTRIDDTRAYQVNASVFWSAARDLKQFGDIFTAKIEPSNSAGGRPEVEFVLRARHIPIATATRKKSTTRAKKEPHEHG